MTTVTTRELRALVRVTGGAIRETPAGVEFYRSDRPCGTKEVASVLVGVWDGKHWRPLSGPVVPCPDAGEAVALFRAASLARVGPAKPPTARRALMAGGSTRAGVTTGRSVPRNRGVKPSIGGGE